MESESKNLQELLENDASGEACENLLARLQDYENGLENIIRNKGLKPEAFEAYSKLQESIALSKNVIKQAAVQMKPET